MTFGTQGLKWTARCALAATNKALARMVGIKRLKKLNVKLRMHRDLDLENPKKLNEKILCLAYDTDSSLWSRLADKYAVRDYVRGRGLEDILLPVYGVYESFDEIDFDALPDKFVLKATHGCDMNYICRDKSAMDREAVRKKVNFWLKTSLAYIALEPHYEKIPHRVLCEQFLETQGEIIDYKFFCCDGRARFVEVCSQRSKGPYLDIFTLDWEHRPEAIVGAKSNPQGIQKPDQFQRMIEIANTLARDLPFVRVDLYQVDGKVYFGEMTFTPATGVLFHFSEAFLLEQGQLYDLREPV